MFFSFIRTFSDSFLALAVNTAWATIELELGKAEQNSHLVTENNELYLMSFLADLCIGLLN